MKSLLRTIATIVATCVLLLALLFTVFSALGVSAFPAEYALYVAGAGTLAAFIVLSLRHVASEPGLRVTARELGSKGQSVPQIARQLRMSQDAVRGLLAPDPAAARVRSPGNNFRYHSRNVRA